MKSVKSLEAVHTHTHTHVHKNVGALAFHTQLIKKKKAKLT